MDNTYRSLARSVDDPLLSSPMEVSSEALNSSSTTENASNNVAQPSTQPSAHVANCDQSSAFNQPSGAGSEGSTSNSNQAGIDARGGAGSGQSILVEASDCLTSYWRKTSLCADGDSVREAKKRFAEIVHREGPEQAESQVPRTSHALQVFQAGEWMFTSIDYTKISDTFTTMRSQPIIRPATDTVTPVSSPPVNIGLFQPQAELVISYTGIHFFLEARYYLKYECALLLYAHFMGRCVLQDLVAGLDMTPELFFWRLICFFADPLKRRSDFRSSLTSGPERPGSWAFSHLDKTCRDTAHDRPFVMFGFGFRSFKKCDEFHGHWPPPEGFVLAREACDIPFLHKGCMKQTNQIRESRYVSALKLYPDKQSPCFSIFVISDISGSSPEHGRYNDMTQESKNPLIPIMIYIYTMFEALSAAYSEWDEVLTLVESENELQLSSLAGDDSVAQMMFDHAELKRSIFYFKMIQILRILSNGVDDLRRDMEKIPLLWFETLQQRFLGVYCSPPDIHEVWMFWDSNRRMADVRYTALKQRIEVKKLEVESLRDGLFNGTSVREALQARRMNQNILIFTCVTIIYLPLSFVTSLFGMNNIPSDSALLRTMAPFAILIVSIATITYALAFVAQDWYVFRRSGTGKTLKAWCNHKKLLCKQIWDKFLILVRLKKLRNQSWKLKPTNVGP